MNDLQTLQNLKLKALEIANMLDQLIQEEESTGASLHLHEKILLLSMDETAFNGKSPVGVIFLDGRRENAPTWKKVFEIVLKDCNSIPEKHAALMELRGSLFGRTRILLNSVQDGMNSPLEIDNDLFVETNYSASALRKTLKDKILKNVGYDCATVKIIVREH